MSPESMPGNLIFEVFAFKTHEPTVFPFERETVLPSSELVPLQAINCVQKTVISRTDEASLLLNSTGCTGAITLPFVRAPGRDRLH